MNRKFVFAVSLLVAVFSSTLQALGLGEVTVKSSLNQPLVAEIALINTTGLTEDEILPGLATRDEFARAGIDRVHFLTGLKFSVQPKGNGHVIRLTTNKPVKEPFLNFLVEVIWPSGRLLREYAMLIDPPVFANNAPANQVQAAAPASAPAPAPAPAPSTAVQSLPAATPAPAPVARPASSGPRTYRTSSNDTLWEIALEVRPDQSISPQQAMLAIRDTNPNGFIDQNINRLKSGVVLRIPEKEEMLARSKQKALLEVIDQNKQFSSRSAAPVDARDASQVADSAAPSASDKTVSGGDELKLLVPSATSSQANTTNSGQAQDGTGRDVVSDADLTVALEKLDQSLLENEELSSRLEDLEEQIKTLQKLVTVKDQQMAAFQAQMAANTEAANETTPETSEGAGASATASAVADADATAESAADPAEADVADGAADAETVEAGAEEAIAEEAAQPAEVAETVAAAEAAPSEAPQTREDWAQKILSNPLYMGGIGAIVLIVLLVLWMISKKRAEDEMEHYAEAEVVEDDQFDFKEDVSDFEPAAYVEDEDSAEYEEESVRGSVEEEGAEQDVLSEADVYIAYGRLDQAAHVIEQALIEDGTRADLRLKLLEVFVEMGDQEAFDLQFGELQMLGDDLAVETAYELREQFAERAPVQAEPSEESTASPSEAEEPESEAADPGNQFDFDQVEEAATEEPGDDLDLALEGLEQELDLALDLPSLTDNEDSSDNTLNLDLGETAPELESDAVEDALDEAALDYELSGIGEEEPVEEPKLDIKAPELTDDASIDFEPATETPVEPEVPAAADSSAEAGELTDAEKASLDDALSELDLDEFDEDHEEEQAGTENEIDLPKMDDLDLASVETAITENTAGVEESGGQDDILEKAAEALENIDDMEADADLENDESFGFLDGADEVATKLDLAKAYIDMGDVSGAKEILQEVIEEGSDQQKSDAQGLIDQIA